MALDNLARIYAQQISPWQQQLYGPRAIAFDPYKTQMEGFLEKDTEEDAKEDAVTKIEKEIRKYAERAGHDPSDPINQGKMPNITDPDYWAGQFSPDIGWETTKSYAPYMALGLANPMRGVMALAKNTVNPTQDPAWQEAAKQYLGSIGSSTSLSDLTKSINQLYASDPMGAGVFASDAALGAMFGLPESPMSGTMTAGMGLGLEPYELAQAARGANMIGMDPTSRSAMAVGLNAPGSAMAGYGYTGPDLSSLSRTHTRNLIGIQRGDYSIGGPVAQAAQRTKDRMDRINRSNEWMEATLRGDTTDTFDKWNGGDGGGRGNTNAGGYGGSPGSAGGYEGIGGDPTGAL